MLEVTTTRHNPGVDPLLAGLMLTPVFFVLGLGIYQFYYLTFERRGSDQGLRGIAFFFGIAFIVQVALGDLPHGSVGYQTIFAAGLTLMLMTLVFNILGYWLRKKYREQY